MNEWIRKIERVERMRNERKHGIIDLLIRFFEEFELWWNLTIYHGSDKPNKFNCIECFMGFDKMWQLWNHACETNHGFEKN